MFSYLTKRLLLVIPTLLGATLLTFALSYFSPSDPILARYSSLGIVPDAQTLAAERAEAGLDDPFLVQYLRWLSDAAQGDFGESYSYGSGVSAEILKRLPNTLCLAAATIVCTVLLSIPLGIAAAVYRDTWADCLLRFVSFAGTAMPSFWVAMLLMYAFGVRLKWLPVMGSSSPRHLILPCATLTFWQTAVYIRRIRGSVLEELGSRYVRGALARGIPERRVLRTHVLPNALLSIIPTAALSISTLLSGTTVVETIFEYQGIGKMIIAAIGVRDYPIVLGYTVWVSAIYIAVSLAADIASRLLDPRIRPGGQ